MTLPPPPGSTPPYRGDDDPFAALRGYPGAQRDPSWQQPFPQAPPAGQPWAATPPPGLPRTGGGKLKWVLGAVGLVAVIAVTATVSIAATRGTGGGHNTAPPAAGPSTASSGGIASANDTGPVNIITEDPTCAAWTPINNSVSAAQTDAGWADHDYTIPVAQWTPELRRTYEAVSKSLSTAADQAVALAGKTPHRLMRELYEQFSAYSYLFAKSLDTYESNNSYLAGVAVNISTTILYICDAIDYKSAAARAPFVPDVEQPSNNAPPPDLSHPTRFMASADRDCGRWQSMMEKFGDETKAWGVLDPTIPADKWTADQHEIIDAAAPIMKQYADDIESVGRGSENATVQEFAVYSAQYWRAYVAALPTYTRNDLYLTQVASQLTTIIVQACLALAAS